MLKISNVRQSSKILPTNVCGFVIVSLWDCVGEINRIIISYDDFLYDSTDVKLLNYLRSKGIFIHVVFKI